MWKKGHWTPLLLSVDYNRIDILDLLLAAGANINAVTEVSYGIISTERLVIQ